MKTLLENRTSKLFFDSWEEKSQVDREAFIRSTLDSYVRYSREHCEYYRESLAGYDAKAEFPLKHVPVLNSGDLRKLVPPSGSALVVNPTQGYTVFQSGGTTGAPKSTLFSHSELDRLDLPNARGFYALGLRPEDRVGNLFAVGSLYMTFVHINRMLQQYGCINFPFSNHTNTEFIHTVVKMFRVNVLSGIASVVMNALRGMNEIGLEGIHIEKIFYGGEHLYEADKREIEKKFGTKLIGAPGYGTVDTWYIGYQCSECPTGVFHAHDDECYMEIVDEETNTHSLPGTPGMLYATAFPRKLTPIVRYRVGDRAIWLKEPCSCGRTTPLFKLIGRGDDVLRIGYDSIDYNAIQDVVLRVRGLSGTVQIQKRRFQGKDELTIRIESEEPESSYPFLIECLTDELIKSRPAFKDFQAKGTIWPLKVELMRPGTLKRNERTGKLIRVIDAVIE